jgi:hypothetical protein
MRLSALVALVMFPAALDAQDPSPGALEVKVSGLIITNFFHNSAEFNNSDVPTFLVAPPPGVPEKSLGATVRQTQLKVSANMANVLGGSLHGEVETDFFGGQQPSGGGRTHALVRVRRAFLELQWRSFALLVGQEAPPIAEVNPTGLATLGFPGFAAAGNLWLWLPQVRATAILNPDSRIRFGVEAAALAPNSGDPQDPFTTEPDLAERSDRPFLEGRLLVRWGQDDMAGDLSVGGHLGWLATAGDSLLESHAVAVALRFPLSALFEIRGEVFHGQALAGLGGGGIGQNQELDGSPLETTGGWAQLIIRPSREVELAAGLGIDNPQANPSNGRNQNQVAAAHLLWQPNPLVFGIEYRRFETTFGSELEGGHLNLAAGLRF